MSSGFVSEAELAEKRRVRQEEWEKVRQATQPVDVPEEPFDSRSLFDKLEEQKQKKQQDYEEAHKLKNMIKGLDDDEVQFLDLVDQKKMEAEMLKEQEEEKELLEFRKKVEELKNQTLDHRIQTEIKNSKPTNTIMSSSKSQQQLLKGVLVKRKSSGDSSDISKPKIAKTEAGVFKEESSDKKRKRDNNTEEPASKSGLTCVGILPSLCNYAESSDESDGSESGSSELESEVTKYDLVGRKLVYATTAKTNEAAK